MELEIGSGSSLQEVSVLDTVGQDNSGEDGSSACTKSFSLIDAPSFLTMEGSTLTITSNDMNDEVQEHTVTLRVSLEENPDAQYQSSTFKVSLVCPRGSICNHGLERSPEALPEVGCDSGPPKYLDEYSGVSGASPEIDEWYVPYRFYRLAKVTLFHDGQ